MSRDYPEYIAFNATTKTKQALDLLKEQTGVPTAVRVRRAVDRMVKEELKKLEEIERLRALAKGQGVLALDDDGET